MQTCRVLGAHCGAACACWLVVLVPALVLAAQVLHQRLLAAWCLAEPPQPREPPCRSSCGPPPADGKSSKSVAKALDELSVKGPAARMRVLYEALFAKVGAGAGVKLTPLLLERKKYLKAAAAVRIGLLCCAVLWSCHAMLCYGMHVLVARGGGMAGRRGRGRGEGGGGA